MFPNKTHFGIFAIKINKMEQRTSLWERLKICYKALTQDYYVFFGFDKDMFIEGGEYLVVNRKKTSSFQYIPDELILESDDGENSVRLCNFLWKTIEKIARKRQKEAEENLNAARRI